MAPRWSIEIYLTRYLRTAFLRTWSAKLKWLPHLTMNYNSKCDEHAKYFDYVEAKIDGILSMNKPDVSLIVSKRIEST